MLDTGSAQTGMKSHISDTGNVVPTQTSFHWKPNPRASRARPGHGLFLVQLSISGLVLKGETNPAAKPGRSHWFLSSRSSLSCGKCPCPQQGWNGMVFNVLFYPKYSMDPSLWFLVPLFSPNSHFHRQKRICYLNETLVSLCLSHFISEFIFWADMQCKTWLHTESGASQCVCVCVWGRKKREKRENS